MALSDSPAGKGEGRHSRLLVLPRPSQRTACFVAYKSKRVLVRHPDSYILFLFLASLFRLVYNSSHKNIANKNEAYR